MVRAHTKTESEKTALTPCSADDFSIVTVAMLVRLAHHFTDAPF
jgi:hypothetical protein